MQDEDKLQVMVTMDKDLAEWLYGFAETLLATFTISDLNKDTMNLRAVRNAVKEGLEDANNSQG
jgi:hypothetical protein